MNDQKLRTEACAKQKMAALRMMSAAPSAQRLEAPFYDGASSVLRPVRATATLEKTMGKDKTTYWKRRPKKRMIRMGELGHRWWGVRHTGTEGAVRGKASIGDYPCGENGN